MLTNPNTVGLFEDNVAEICELIHSAGGQVYCDGANMNALVGRARPGDMGFDVMHYNLHKTFSSPHGGGGPGSGPVSVKSHLVPFLPAPIVVKTDEGYDLDFNRPGSVGKIHGFYGSFMCILRSYVFIMYYGQERLKNISENAVLNANYVRVKLQDQYDVAFDELCMHECIFTLKRQSKDYGIKAIDVAKRLMDFGIHPPTMYFPLIVAEALMVEPTETESVQTLDRFVQVMQQIAYEAEHTPDVVRNAPTATPVRKLDEATAARQPEHESHSNNDVLVMVRRSFIPYSRSPHGDRRAPSRSSERVAG
jgi:glycine dehydrogenase subunit 2